GVRAALLRAALPLLVLLRRCGRRSRAGCDLDRRQGPRPRPRDLDREQHDDHSQHCIDDRPASHQVAPGAAGEGGGCASAAGGGAAGGGATAAGGGGGAGATGTGAFSAATVRRTATLRNGSAASSRMTWVLSTETPFSEASVLARSCKAAAARVPVSPGSRRLCACASRFFSSARSARNASTAPTKRAKRSSRSCPSPISSATRRR